MSNAQQSNSASTHSAAQKLRENPVLVLTLFALLCASLIFWTQSLTSGPIQQAKDEALMQQFAEIVPRNRFDNNVAQDCITRIDRDWLGTDAPVKIFRLRAQGQPVAVLVQAVAPDGFAGRIDLLIGVYTDSALAGVRVRAHKETPGLGDKIETAKSDWIKRFAGLSLQQPAEENWLVKKDGGEFDAFTGATITPRAVVGAVQKTLHYVALHQHDLYTEAASCHAP